MKKSVWIIIGSVVLVLAVVGWMRFRQGTQTASTEVEYDYYRVQKMNLSEKIESTGSVTLAKSAEIYPAFEAIVKTIKCKAGDRVKQGQVLMVLESATLTDKYIEIRDSLAQARLNLEAANKELTTAEALFKVQGITIDQLQAAQDKVKLVKQQYFTAQNKAGSLQQQPDDANSYNPSTGQLVIKAPYQGVVGWVNTVIGARVRTEEQLLSLTADGAWEVQAEIDESEIAEVQAGQKVEITLSDVKGTVLSGVVTEVGRVGKVDAEVVTFPVKIKINSGEEALKVGMSVDLSILTKESPAVLAVPSSAVVERRGRQMILQKTDDGVNYVQVETGMKTSSYIEIVSGLKRGDQIAIAKPKAEPIKQQNGNQQMNQMNNFGGGSMGGSRNMGGGFH